MPRNAAPGGQCASTSTPRPSTKVSIRKRIRNLSPTRAPEVAADRAFWPSWCHLPIEKIGYILLDDNGYPLSQGGN